MNHSIEIDINDPHAEVVEDILTEVELRIKAIRDRWNKTDDRIVHTADLDDLLAGQRAIAIVWDIHHVKDQRPDLDAEQAWKVLQDCHQCQQCCDRMRDEMREIILDTADRLYPQHLQDRPVKAAAVIAGYGKGDERENVVDLLTDMMHWCQGSGQPFDEFCVTARMHFAAESNSTPKGSKP